MPLGLLALAVSTFAIGTTEFVIVGLVPELAVSLGVSVPVAGLLVSLYAMSITLGTPVFSALTGKAPRRALILALMAVFAATNLTAALSPNYELLLASRIVMGVAHGVFFGVGTTVAMSLVSKEKSGSAVAIMMGGLTVAMVVGVPLGSWLGQTFSWRAPFLIVSGLGAIALLGLHFFLPKDIAFQPSGSFLSQMKLLGERRLATLYLLTAVGFGGTFAVFTFISPLLTDVTGLAPERVNIALVLFGGATVVGNFLGGRLTDAFGTRHAMLILLTGLIASLALIPASVHNSIAIFAVIATWGIFAFAIPPVMQSGVVAVASEVAPAALGTASGFNIAAFNLGISSGSFIGGRLLAGPGVMATPYAAIAMAGAAFLIALFALNRSERRQVVASSCT